METPVCDFVRAYAESDSCRLHMPGHKGKGPLGIEVLDITEIGGADVLYHSEGILKQSQENAAALFGTVKTLYSAEGSSLAIRAMVALVAMRSAGRPRIASGRNAHKVFMSACALLDVDVDWLYPDPGSALVCCDISAAYLEKYLSDQTVKPDAVYITSPDYLGNIADISRIAEVCHRYGVLLLVDNAHGAYLRFLSASLHPMDLGADLCCDSAHKTLPVLTGGAYLHISPSAPRDLAEQAENAMALFASTSPSYLILQSLDAANRYLAGGYRQRLEEMAQSVAEMKCRLQTAGFHMIGEEPLKVTVSARTYGYFGDHLARILEESGLICEFSDPDYVVFMVTPENTRDDLRALEAALCNIPRKAAIVPPMLPKSVPVRKLSIREAILSPKVHLPLNKCRGRVLGDAAVSCPPAVPVAVCGELLDDAVLEKMHYYGITECDVVK